MACRKRSLVGFSLGTAVLLAASGLAAAADVSKAGSAEVYANPAGQGGFAIGFSNQYAADECVSSGTPGDAFAFWNYLLVDNTNGVDPIAVEFAVAIYEASGGVAGALLYSDSVTLTAAAGEVASGVQGGVSVEYTGWNGDASCGGNFLVERTVEGSGGSLGSFTNQVIY